MMFVPGHYPRNECSNEFEIEHFFPRDVCSTLNFFPAVWSLGSATLARFFRDRRTQEGPRAPGGSRQRRGEGMADTAARPNERGAPERRKNPPPEAGLEPRSAPQKGAAGATASAYTLSRTASARIAARPGDAPGRRRGLGLRPTPASAEGGVTLRLSPMSSVSSATTHSRPAPPLDLVLEKQMRADFTEFLREGRGPRAPPTPPGSAYTSARMASAAWAGNTLCAACAQ